MGVGVYATTMVTSFISMEIVFAASLPGHATKAAQIDHLLKHLSPPPSRRTGASVASTSGKKLAPQGGHKGVVKWWPLSSKWCWNLNGAGLVRLEDALVDACVKFEEAVKNGLPLPSPISSPVMCKSYPAMPNFPVFVSPGENSQ
ncbi:unnamed protein product [Sphagnum troendelagicum]